MEKHQPKPWAYCPGGCWGHATDFTHSKFYVIRSNFFYVKFYVIGSKFDYSQIYFISKYFLIILVTSNKKIVWKYFLKNNKNNY